MKLLEPIALGAATAPNRILFGPHVTNLGRGRALSERHTAYYRRRAEGGCGVIVCEEAAVHPSDWSYERAPLATECPPGWADIAAACRPHGALVLAAIGHTGGQGSSAYSQREMWAPSGIPEVNTREVPKVMETSDIAEVLAGFAQAAAAAVASGLDGVEVNAGQHSLVRQFLSGLTNQRGDEYGADRLRFATEVLRGVRAAAGDGVVGLRLSCDELAPWAGITPDAAAEIAATLSAHVDYVVVVRGSIFSVAATRPDMHDEPGFNLDLVHAVRQAVPGRQVPLCAQGSIVEVGQAEWALADVRCDLVEMTRAQIADAALATKTASHPDRIRPCPLDNQRDQVRDGCNPLVSSSVDPRSGHELVDPDLEAGAAADPRHVLVVGGGVAGLECARVAAARGHRVTLVERSDHLGGVLRVAARGAGRSRWTTFVDWLEAECARLGVQIHLGVEARPEQLATDDRPVVLAVGGRDAPPGYEVGDGAEVVTVRALLEADDPAGSLPAGPVAVWDPIGGPWAISVAELLAAAGRQVALITPDFITGTQLSLTGDLAPANTRLQAAGIELVKRARLRCVDADGVIVHDPYSGGSARIEAAALVDAGHRLPADDRWGDHGGEVYRAGDCVAPRDVHAAVLEARRAVADLEAGAAR